jgi:phosphoglycerate dehydrogenase-like enzyme
MNSRFRSPFSAKCYITPHIAGRRANESVRLVGHFLDNLKRFEEGIPLIDRVR